MVDSLVSVSDSLPDFLPVLNGSQDGKDRVMLFFADWPLANRPWPGPLFVPVCNRQQPARLFALPRVYERV